METIQVTRSSMPEYWEYCEVIKKLWDSHWLTNNGEIHKEFQRTLEQYLGVRHVTLYANGHLALENIIQAYGFPKGSEVITTPFTFASTTNAIVRCGLKPVFCDIRRDNLTIDAGKIEDLITDKTVAILPVHVYGNLCDVRAIDEIAKKHGLKVIYDAAHAFGVTYFGVSAACFGDASMFSFHATKVFNTIEGGAVTYNDDSLVEKLDSLKNFGLVNGGEDVGFVGGNAKMNEFQAAMGICNLRHLKREIEKRKAVVKQYRDRLYGIKGIRIMDEQNGVESNYAYFPVVIWEYHRSRDEVFTRLAERGIMARKYFSPLTSGLSCYAGMEGFDPMSTKYAVRLVDHIMTLPLYADLSIDDVDRICDIILS